ncbi:MAG: hypothetical protein JXR96_25835, partial [Deltaproteobacteria bacterium]|nr:hypothetical protein [Deltaproteobacteria bacterium]
MKRSLLILTAISLVAACGSGTVGAPPCQDSDCDSPPADECIDAQTLRSYGQGHCVDGDCVYDHTDTTCPQGCAG